MEVAEKLGNGNCYALDPWLTQNQGSLGNNTRHHVILWLALLFSMLFKHKAKVSLFICDHFDYCSEILSLFPPTTSGEVYSQLTVPLAMWLPLTSFLCWHIWCQPVRHRDLKCVHMTGFILVGLHHHTEMKRTQLGHERHVTLNTEPRSRVNHVILSYWDLRMAFMQQKLIDSPH